MHFDRTLVLLIYAAALVSSIANASDSPKPWQGDRLAEITLEMKRGPLFVGKPGWSPKGERVPHSSYRETALVIPLWEKATGLASGVVRFWCHTPTGVWTVLQFGLWNTEIEHIKETYMKYDIEFNHISLSFHSASSTTTLFDVVGVPAPGTIVGSPVNMTRVAPNMIYGFIHKDSNKVLANILHNNGQGAFQIQLRQVSGNRNSLQAGELRTVFRATYASLKQEEYAGFSRAGLTEIERIDLQRPCTDIARE